MTEHDRSAELLPIGRFARACRLGVKALRHYDELGLLRPRRVDASGYRYYARAQAREAIAIALLRSLDVPLPAIKAVLGAADPIAVSAALARERARIEQQIARAQQALSCVERIIREGELMPYTVSTREVAAHTLLAVTETTTPERHVEVGYALFARLGVVARDLGLSLHAPVVCLLPEPPDGESMVLQMASTVRGPLEVATLTRAGAARIEIPAHTFAFVTHRGSYEELGLAQHAIAAWVEERGHATTGPLREVYLNDPAHIASDALLTEVGVPLAG